MESVETGWERNKQYTLSCIGEYTVQYVHCLHYLHDVISSLNSSNNVLQKNKTSTN